MKKTKFLRVLVMLAAVFIITAAFSTAAFAYAGEAAAGETPPPAEEPTPDPEPAVVYDPKPLTPDGNLTLVDDISGEQGTDKQFITVITKSGNYFYIVIDRAGDKENVHFLNLVDEADLLALIEDGGDALPAAPPTAAAEPEEPQGVRADTEPSPKPEKSNAGGIAATLVLIAALCGGAFYYFRILKTKQNANKGSTGVSELDEFDFDGDGEDFDGAAELENRGGDGLSENEMNFAYGGTDGYFEEETAPFGLDEESPSALGEETEDGE